MPIPRGAVWRHCRARKQLTSDEAAKALQITGGALRQIEAQNKPASLRLAYRAADLYAVEVDTLLQSDQQPSRQRQPRGRGHGQGPSSSQPPRPSRRPAQRQPHEEVTQDIPEATHDVVGVA